MNDADTLGRVHELNAAHATETSSLTREALAALWGEAFMAEAIETGGTCAAFLIALDQDAAYESVNFAWFRERYPTFVYVDRIVTAPAARGRGLAGGLYAELFRRARAAGHTLVGCEVNLEPPNPVSDRFHAASGFGEVGRARLVGKTVRYLAREM